jgi:pilus assembly protein CpaF
MSLIEELSNRKYEKKPYLVHQQEEVKVDADELRRIVRESIITSGDISYIYTEEGKKNLAKRVLEEVNEKYPKLSRMERANIAHDIVADITGYGPIQPLIEDPEVSDILINRYDVIYYDKKGVLYRSPIKFRDETHLRNMIERIVSNVGRRLDESQPLVDARLPDGSRINAAIPPVAVDGPTLAIRRFNYNIDVDDLIESGVLNVEQIELLQKFIDARLNIVISGGTGTGKTTFLNVLSQMIHYEERVVTIEEVTKLNLKVRNLVRFEVRRSNVEGKGEISARQLVVNALRMRPDRIIVGECRESEAFDMLQAMNTGHDGSLTTLHANTPQDALYRLENMVLMAGFDLPTHVIRDYIASALHIIIHLSRLRSGKRVIKNIAEVKKDGNNICTVDLYRRENDQLVKVGEPSERIKARLLEAER